MEYTSERMHDLAVALILAVALPKATKGTYLLHLQIQQRYLKVFDPALLQITINFSLEQSSD